MNSRKRMFVIEEIAYIFFSIDMTIGSIIGVSSGITYVHIMMTGSIMAIILVLINPFLYLHDKKKYPQYYNNSYKK